MIKGQPVIVPWSCREEVKLLDPLQILDSQTEVQTDFAIRRNTTIFQKKVKRYRKWLAYCMHFIYLMKEFEIRVSVILPRQQAPFTRVKSLHVQPQVVNFFYKMATKSPKFNKWLNLLILIIKIIMCNLTLWTHFIKQKEKYNFSSFWQLLK